MEMFKPFRRYPNDPNLFFSNLEKNSENLWQFDVVSTDKFSANTFKRILSSHIPSFAIGSVLFENNTSYILDEFIAMRLGLVPIIANVDIIESLNDLDLDTIENTDNFGSFRLNMECPKNAQRPILVTSGDLIAENYPFDFEVLDPNITIVKLLPGQSINISAIIQIGSGSFNTFSQNCRDHAKWNPVSNCIFLDDYEKILSPSTSPCQMNLRGAKTSEVDASNTYKIEMELIGTMKASTILDMAMKMYVGNQ